MRIDGIGCLSPEYLYLQVLLKPFKEEFNLPTIFVQISNNDRIHGHIIGEKDVCSICFIVIELDASKLVGIVPIAACRRESNDLITADAGAFVHRQGV